MINLFFYCRIKKEGLLTNTASRVFSNITLISHYFILTGDGSPNIFYKQSLSYFDFNPFFLFCREQKQEMMELL